MKFPATSVAALSALMVMSTVGVASAQLTDVIIKFAGEDISIPLSEQKSYNGGQDEYLKRPLILSDGGRNVTLEGNMHRALPFPEKISLTPSTTIDFDFYLGDEEEVHALCIDYDLNQNGRQCFVIGGTQQIDWPTVDPDITNSPGSVQQVGETRHYTINVGQYFTGSARYKWLVLMQDNDSSNRDTGLSSFANIEFGYQTPLVISQESAIASVASSTTGISLVMSKEVSARPSQDQFGNPLLVSDDGLSISMQNNVWRAVPFSTPVTVGINDNLEFDFTLREKTEHHAICLLEEPGEFGFGPYCFVLGNTQEWNGAYNILPKANEGETPIHYSIPMGLVFAGRTFNYLAFVQDNDVGDRLYGDMTFSNVTIKDMGSRPQFKITVGGSEVFLDSTEVISASPWGSDQDAPYHFLEYPDDGESVTLKGNAHKGFKLPSPIDVTAATEITFDFWLDSEPVENHVVCLLKEDLTKVGGDRGCVQIAGYQSSSFSRSFTKVGDSYKVPIGINANLGAEKQVAHYISLMQDNDKSNERDNGVSTFSKINIYDRPSLSVDIYGTETLLLNNQLSYSSGQDTSSRLLTVSDGGKNVTLAGNLWKAFEFTTPVKITDSTILSLKLDVEEVTDITAICLDKDRVEGREVGCLKLAGTQTTGLGKIVYKGIKQTYQGEPEANYLIKLSEIITGDMNYIAFVHDNDTPDRSTGISHIRDIRLYNEQSSCLDGASNFTFSVDECTVSSFLDGIEKNVPECANLDPMEELLTYFGAKSDAEVSTRIQSICASANAPNMVDFAAIMESENQFIEETFDGGTTWNYLQTAPKNLARIQAVSSNYGGDTGISLPDVHNFHGCKLRAAMCCYVAQRARDGSELVEPIVDNADACYMDFSEARQSSHVRDGYSIYGNQAEGAFNCHGFAWGNDLGYGDATFKGNTLFNIAMTQGLFDNQYVEELPGAPLCGCIEQMPVVDNADCTKTSVTQTVTVDFDANTSTFFAEATVTNITHQPCGTDLRSYYATLATEGKATSKEQAELEERIVGKGSCPAAITGFLGKKGLVFKETSK